MIVRFDRERRAVDSARRDEEDPVVSAVLRAARGI